MVDSSTESHRCTETTDINFCADELGQLRPSVSGLFQHLCQSSHALRILQQEAYNVSARGTAAMCGPGLTHKEH